MSKPKLRTISPVTARRLAIERQRLSGPRPPASHEGMLDVLRDIRCLQLDPISAVARSHQLVLFSRLGGYDLAHLDTLLWQDRSLFEYWAHAASMVLTEDYPIHNLMMRQYVTSDSAWSTRVRAWMEQNKPLHDHILKELAERGPLLSRQLQGQGFEPEGWVSTGWSNDRNVSRMLDFLWIRGQIMVAGRSGGQKIWDLTERCLPEWTPRESLSESEVAHNAAQKSLRALGVGTSKHINVHFIRGRYTKINNVIKELESDSLIQRVQIADENGAWAGDWYIHADDLPLLERIEAGDWQPRTTLLSPFDNLICDRQRTEKMFSFEFRIEIYVPKAKRQYGYYVLPILHGDQLIGRIDPTMNRKTKQLIINNVYAESNAPTTPEAASAVARSIDELAAFLGAKEIVYPDSECIPVGWRPALG
ncbi:MAG: YcaQ family DNA glycosylase [Burkholderiales bacterium]|nr:YcaQ family DNA glycosylase [Anaerolineae bacterium]